LLVLRRRRAASAGPVDRQHAGIERPGLGTGVLANLLSDHELVAVPLRRGRAFAHLAHRDLALAAIELVGRGDGWAAAASCPLDREFGCGLLYGHRAAATAPPARVFRGPGPAEVRFLRN